MPTLDGRSAGGSGLDLLVLAELNPDVLVRCDGPVRFGQVEQLVNRATITLGSSGAITASAAAALGLRVGVCAVVGDDDLGRLTVDLLRRRNVDVHGVVVRPGMSTGMTVVLSRPDGDRAMLTFSGTMGELAAPDVDVELITAARHVHVSSFFLQQALQHDVPTLFDTARASGATTSMDPGWDPYERWVEIVPTLPHVDVLLPNAQECRHIGAAAPNAQLTELVSTLVIKDGALGARATTSHGSWQVSPASVEVVDTTGAGDNFDAGFLFALLTGRDTADALRLGAACGAIAVTGWGGTGALAELEQADRVAAALSCTLMTDHYAEGLQ